MILHHLAGRIRVEKRAVADRECLDKGIEAPNTRMQLTGLSRAVGQLGKPVGGVGGEWWQA